MMTDIDIQYMRLAIIEARKGLGRTAPNPAVGAVIVNDNRVVGYGYHHRAGEAHAEINAIADAREAAQGATIYVTLEPCNHTGKTPPCSRAILKAGISRVVIGLLDPNPNVQGGGKEFLQSQGVEVESGILEQECRALVRPFIKHSREKIPWVILKAGMSLDGKITYTKGKGGKITGSEAHHYVHQLRDQTDAILIGANTARIDDPSLTTRLEDKEGRDPLRVILDSRLRISPHAKMLTQRSTAETIIFHSHHAPRENITQLKRAGCTLVPVETSTVTGYLSLTGILSRLGDSNITSVLVEGGSHVHGSFLQQNMVDEYCLFYAPFFIGDRGQNVLHGFSCTSLPARQKFTTTEVTQLGEDVLIRGIREEHLM